MEDGIKALRTELNNLEEKQTITDITKIEERLQKRNFEKTPDEEIKPED